MAFCPRCRHEFDSTVTECAKCHLPLVATLPPLPEGVSSWSETVTVLTGPSELALLPAKSLLEENGIRAIVENEALSTIYGGLMDLALTRGGPALRVVRQDEKRANEILCENNIRCDVPADAVERVVTRVFAPSITGQESFEPDRILGLLSHQTRDFRKAVFGQAAHLFGGAEYLVKLLVISARDGHGEPEVRNDLASVLAIDHGGATAAALADAALEADDSSARQRLATGLGHFRYPAAARALVRLLEDRDAAVRDEALESLYFLNDGETFDYEPGGPDADRAAAIEKWRSWVDSLGHGAEAARRD